jgi:predicted hydrocarbon binding protein
MVLFHEKGLLAQTPAESMSHEQTFKENWVKALMENLEKQLDEKTRIRLMETCGRDCARRGAIQIAAACKGDVERMVRTLARIPGLEIDRKDDGAYRVIYRKCFCELVGQGPDRLPATYCECSRGWLLEMFGTAVEKPVVVKIIRTIRRGDEACEFVIVL